MIKKHRFGPNASLIIVVVADCLGTSVTNKPNSALKGQRAVVTDLTSKVTGVRGSLQQSRPWQREASPQCWQAFFPPYPLLAPAYFCFSSCRPQSLPLKFCSVHRSEHTATLYLSFSHLVCI